MNNADFWASVNAVVDEEFTPEGLRKLDRYAEDFIIGRLVYQRFSSLEQHGCSEGGAANVIATILAGAETGTDCNAEDAITEFQRERKRGTQQEARIECWAKATGVWIDEGCVAFCVGDCFGGLQKNLAFSLLVKQKRGIFAKRSIKTLKKQIRLWHS